MTELQAKGHAQRLAAVLWHFATGTKDPSLQVWRFPGVAGELREMADHFAAMDGAGDGRIYALEPILDPVAPGRASGAGADVLRLKEAK